jgi:hypothetical protein
MLTYIGEVGDKVWKDGKCQIAVFVLRIQDTVRKKMEDGRYL